MPDDWELCCGSAGTYNVEQPDTAAELGRRKAEHLRATGADVVAAGNIGCLTQIRLHLAELPVRHTIQILDRDTPELTCGDRYGRIATSRKSYSALRKKSGEGPSGYLPGKEERKLMASTSTSSVRTARLCVALLAALLIWALTASAASAQAPTTIDATDAPAPAWRPTDSHGPDRGRRSAGSSTRRALHALADVHERQLDGAGRRDA